MIEVKNLTKEYGSNVALDDVSFSVSEGSIVGFLGPNGAGKSTTMNIITGYISAGKGEVEIGGKTIMQDANKYKTMIGYLPEVPPLYTEMTVKEYLNFIYELKKVKLNKAEHIKGICDITKITDVMGRLIGNLSKGYRQRVGIAQALIGNPPVLILDEPTVGLDPKQIIEIRALIKNLSKTHTVILSSHILSEIQAVCDRIIVINKGKIVADGNADTLAHDLSSEHKIVVRIEGDEKAIIDEINKINMIKEVISFGEKEPGVFEFSVEAENDMDIRRELFMSMAENKMPILSMKSTDITLEELFIRLTGSDEAMSYEDEEDEEELEEEPVQENKEEEEDK